VLFRSRSIALVARTVVDQEKTDIRISFWKVMLLTIPTLGIYNIITYYRLMRRMEKHIERQHLLYRDILSYLQEYVFSKDLDIDCLIEYKNAVNNIEFEEEAICSSIWMAASIITLGIASIYPIYRLTSDPFKHEKSEEEIILKANDILNKLNILDEPITKTNHCKHKFFLVYLILTIMSFGLFSFYWTYVLINELNKHFEEHKLWENKLLNTLSKF
jgi:hypothetical protein